MKTSGPAARRALEILALAVVVLVTGRLGLLLALPPGYASPIWPPTGFALAGLLILGRRVWPGIWLGSFLLNLITAPEFDSALLAARSLAIPAAIASGTTLQALFGSFLLRRFGGWPHGLVSARGVALFLLLGGPVACLVAPTVGVSSLALTGLIPADYRFHWVTWWSGDVLGVIVFAPLLALWPQPGEAARANRLAAVGLPMLTICALAVMLFAAIARWEGERTSREFNRRCGELRHKLEKSIQGNLEVLQASAAVLESSAEPSRAEFSRFAMLAL